MTSFAVNCNTNSLNTNTRQEKIFLVFFRKTTKQKMKKNIIKSMIDATLFWCLNKKETSLEIVLKGDSYVGLGSRMSCNNGLIY